jgi:hypothetical protein
MAIQFPSTSFDVRRKMARMQRFLFTLCLLLLASCAFAQQNYVAKYDVFTGFSYLDSPHLNLAERGFHTQVGVNPKTWYSLGIDYSVFTGHTALTPTLLTNSLQTQLGTQFGQLVRAGIIPPSYSLVVPINSTTQTITAGPQYDYRHFKKLTLFLRPSVGAIYEEARVKTAGLDPIASAVVNQLAPSGKKTDWTPFYGFGGGFDYLPTNHLGLRVQVDFVHDHLYSDLLKDGRNTVRFSIGPTFRFGKNVAAAM